MKKKYLITIDGVQVFGCDKNVILSTLGDYRKEKDKYFISYNNYDEQDNKSDVTHLEVDADKKVIFSRGGQTGSHLIIERDQKNFSHFRTEDGDTMLGVRANKIMNNLTENGGRLSLSYVMDLNANELFRNNLEITVKEL